MRPIRAGCGVRDAQVRDCRSQAYRPIRCPPRGSGRVAANRDRDFRPPPIGHSDRCCAGGLGCGLRGMDVLNIPPGYRGGLRLRGVAGCPIRFGSTAGAGLGAEAVSGEAVLSIRREIPPDRLRMASPTPTEPAIRQSEGPNRCGLAVACGVSSRCVFVVSGAVLRDSPGVAGVSLCGAGTAVAADSFPALCGCRAESAADSGSGLSDRAERVGVRPTVAGRAAETSGAPEGCRLSGAEFRTIGCGGAAEGADVLVPLSSGREASAAGSLFFCPWPASFISVSSTSRRWLEDWRSRPSASVSRDMAPKRNGGVQRAACSQ